MDTSFTIKPRPGVQRFTRDALPARKAIDTDLGADKSVAAIGDGDGGQRERQHDHPPHDLVTDPESRDVINRENDVSTQPAAREHPDQALARLRAYRPAQTEIGNPPAAEPHANIKA